MRETVIYHLLPGSGPQRAEMIADIAVMMRDAGDFSSMLCLFPTRTHLRHWQRKVFHPMAGECYIPPHMLTLGDFATRTVRNSGHEILDTALRPSIISILTGMGHGFSTLASEFTGELKQHFPGTGPEEIRSNLLRAFEECNIPEEVLTHALRAMDAFDVYESALKGNNFIDREDAYSLAALEIKEGMSFPYQAVIIDGFYELSPAELILLKSILRVCPRTYIFVPISGVGELDYCFTSHISEEFSVEPQQVLPSMPPPEPRLNPARSFESEVEDIARHIKQSYLSGANRELEDTLMVMPDLRPYGSTLRRVFARYGVPLNHSAIERLNYKQGAWGDLVNMVRAVADGFPRLEFSRFLMSPYFRKIPSDVRRRAPGAALSSGVVKGKKAWMKALDTKGTGWVFRTLDSLLDIKDSSSFDNLIRTLHIVMEAFSFHPGDISPAEAASVLERLRPCGTLTGREVSLRAFADSLECLAGSANVDRDSPGVEAAGILDVRGLEPEVLYMGGLKDGDIPSRPDIDLLLPDSVRRHMGLVDIDRYMDLQEKTFTRLRMSAREVYLSYPTAEEDKVFLPSAFLSGIAKSPFPVSGHYCHEEAMTAWGGDSLSPRLREIELPGVYSGGRQMSVTEIDSFRRCPRRFAIERVMGMSPTEVSDYEMAPTELGSIVHRVMEKMITSPPGTFDEFSDRSRKAIDSALSEYGTDKFFSDLIRESVTSSLPGIYELESALSEEGYIVLEKEKLLEGQPIPEAMIRGKADRIDVDAHGRSSIIDYKTGQAAISAQSLEARGENLQLFLYAAMLRDKGMETVRVGIYSLKDISVKWVPGKRDLKKGMDMTHCIETALSYLRATVREMAEGRFPARPITSSVCNSCNEVPFCPHFQSKPDTGGGNA